MATSAWDLSLVIVLLAAAAGPGIRLLAGERAPRLPPTERVLFGAGLGLGAMAIAVTLLGAVGLLGPLPLTALLVAGLGLGWGGLREVPAGLRDLRERCGDAGPVPRSIAGGVLLLALAGMVAAGLAPVTDWDSLMYHLRIPARFLEAGAVVLPEDNLHAAYLGLIHMLYLPLLALGGTVAPALLSTALTALLALAVLSAGARLFPASTGVLSAILLWGSAILLFVGSTPRVDVSLTLFLFLAHYALVLHLVDEDGSPGGLVVAAALAGLAVGIKYQALAYVAPLVPLGIWALVRGVSGRGERLRVAGACVAAFLLAAAPMLLKNLVLFGAPLYPYLADRIVPPWIAAITGSAAPPPGAGSEIYWLIGQARQPFDLLALFLRPGALTVEAEAWAFATNPAFLLVPLALLYFRDRVLMALLLPPVAYLALILVPFEYTNLRYLIPVAPAFTIVSAEVARRALAGKIPATAARLLLITASVAAVAPAARAAGPRLAAPDRLRAAVGILAPEDYLARAPVPGFPAYWDVRNRVHEATGPDARILFLFEARGLYFDRRVVQDNVLTNWPLLRATDAVERCLAGTGITHVLVNLGALGYYRARGMDASPLGLEALEEFRDRCLDPVFDRGGFVFFRVSGPQEPRVPPDDRR